MLHCSYIIPLVDKSSAQSTWGPTASDKGTRHGGEQTVPTKQPLNHVTCGEDSWINNHSLHTHTHISILYHSTAEASQACNLYIFFLDKETKTTLTRLTHTMILRVFVDKFKNSVSNLCCLFFFYLFLLWRWALSIHPAPHPSIPALIRASMSRLAAECNGAFLLSCFTCLTKHIYVGKWCAFVFCTLSIEIHFDSFSH